MNDELVWVAFNSSFESFRVENKKFLYASFYD